MGSIWLCWVICAPRSFVSPPASKQFLPSIWKPHNYFSIASKKHPSDEHHAGCKLHMKKIYGEVFVVCFSFSEVRSFQQMWHRPVCNLLLGTANVSKMEVSAASPCDMFLLFFKVLTGASRQFLILNSWDKLKLWTKRCGMRYWMFTCTKTTFKIISQLLFWRELDSS